MLAEAAKTEGEVIGFGQASDMAEYKPSPRGSSVIENWGPYYIESVGALLDGPYQQADIWAGIKGGEVLIGDITEAVPAEVKAEAEALRDGMPRAPCIPSPGRSTSRTARLGWPKASPRPTAICWA